MRLHNSIGRMLALACLLGSTAARAGSVQADLGVAGAGSTWEGDGAYYTTLAGSYRFARWLEINVATRNGRAKVDDRHLGMLALGLGIWHDLGPVRPYLRGGVIHQHEQPDVSFRANRAESAFGVGDGIRHRGGYAGSVGLGYPMALKTHERTSLVWGADVTMAYFPDERGPSNYWIGALTLGLSYDLR